MPSLTFGRACNQPAVINYRNNAASLATDYIACGARWEQDGSRTVRDEVIGIINIDDKASDWPSGDRDFCVWWFAGPN